MVMGKVSLEISNRIASNRNLSEVMEALASDLAAAGDGVRHCRKQGMAVRGSAAVRHGCHSL
jgi:hypothetical protein